jgi:hypothetical protein
LKSGRLQDDQNADGGEEEPMALTREQQLKWEFEFKMRGWGVEYKIDDSLLSDITTRVEPQFIPEALDYWREKLIEDVERVFYRQRRAIYGR